MRSGAQPPIGSTWHLGSVSEPRPPVGCSPRVRPFPPRPPLEVAFLCSVASSVLRPHPTSHPRTCSAFGFCLPEPARTSPGTGETSQVPHKELLHVRKVSDCARFSPCKPIRHGRCCLLSTERDRHLGIRPVSQLNTRPVLSLVNASRLPSRAEPRASLGVGAVGSTFPVGYFHLLFFASFPGALCNGSGAERLAMSKCGPQYLR